MLKRLIYFILFGIVYRHFRVRVYGSIAQLGEHLPYKQGVIGSSPIVPTITLRLNVREWLSGRASPCQGECREFESRFPLQILGWWQVAILAIINIKYENGYMAL